jgi:hypothetical protein
MAEHLTVSVDATARADTERHARAPSSRRRITRDGTTRGLRVVRDPRRGDVHTV